MNYSKNMMVRSGACAFTPAFLVVIAWFVAVLWISSVNAGAEDVITAQLLRQRTFLEPLVSSDKSTESDDEDLQKALTAFRARGQTDDYSALENFANKHPNSKWLASLHYNLGRECYNSGFYSKALNNWAKAWEMLKSSSDPQSKMLADRAGGELAMMLARVGRMDELSKLLKEFENRPVVGSATERISGARQGLWTMQNRPEIAFRCGPLALDRICAAKYPQLHGHKLIQYSTSTTNGFALDKLAALSAELGMNYQMAYRSPGAPFIVPAVVHWKVWHYAALIEKTGDGRYHLQDPTFGNDIWVTQRALEEETTGYCLVAQGDLPEGWRPVSVEEGKTIFGKGTTSNNDPDSTSDDDQKKDPDCGGSGGMASANAFLMVVSLNIEDTPISYNTPVGPRISFRAVYSHRENGQPAIFSYSNLGLKWTFNWLSYITDNPSSPSANVAMYVDGGGTEPFQNFNSSSQTFDVQLKSQAQLKRTSANSYELLYPDGSKKIFALATPGTTTRQVFMTQVIDPAGNAVTINYDSSYRITNIVDAIGQATIFSYAHPTDPLKITKVTDPFGRYATFQYETGGLLRLTNIIDQIGLNSTFQYSNNTDFVQAMITPYGTSRFVAGESGRNRWLELTDPNGDTERVEFTESTVVGIPNSWPPAMIPTGMYVRNWVDYARNTFYWDKKAYALARNDYTKAKLYHWQHTANYEDAFGVLESEKNALENPVWYNYPGQTALYGAIDDSATRPGYSDLPSKIGRVLDDGTTQLYQYDYNVMGKLTNSADPIGRRMSYLYSTNNLDLLEVRQTTGANNDLISKFLYNNQHLPVATWDAAGQMTTNTYNPRGQLLTTMNARGETSTYSYNANGYLLGVDGPLPGTNDTTSFAYDSAGRVHAATATDGYTLTYGYDNLDRLTNITYPDGTFEAFTFDRLDRSKARDRMGRETYYSYDALRRLVATQDPLNRITRLEYCGCGAMSGLTDPMGRKTTWDYDVQGRLTAKQYADGSRIAYNYENTTSRLKSIVDEKGQFKIYDYNLDDNRRQISYPNAQIATPTVTFGYDTNYNRMLTMQDGIGTTTWSYYPAGVLGALKVSAVDGPWNNDTVTYQYDVLGRAINQAINGVAQTYAYDALSRTTNVVNALGSFNYAYDGATARLLDVSYPNGQTSHYDYYNNLGDDRLQRITHRKPDTSIISRFTYAYNSFGNITNWVQEMGLLNETWSVNYDTANQLLSVLANQGVTNTITYNYGYDSAGNQLYEDINSVRRNSFYNDLNQYISSTDNSTNKITYQWDAEQRLVEIAQGINQSKFIYDGTGRRLKTIEITNGIVQYEKRLVWCGLQLCEERDTNNAVIKKYFEGGFSSNTSQLFFTRDHLGSIRGVSDSLGNLKTIIEYSPFGNQITLTNGVACDWGFANYYLHAPSGLLIAPYRLYSPSQGRWISRDPYAETGGINLYNFVGNNPIGFFDPLGLCKIEVRYNQLGSLFGISWYHAYVVTTDPSGSQTYFRGGPSGNGPSGGSSGAISSGLGGNSSGSSSGSSGSGSSNSSSPGSCKNGGDNGPWGRIRTQSGDYRPGSVDWNPNPTPTVSVLDDGSPCASWNQALQQSMDKINNANIPYNPFGDNSNAAAHQSIKDIGFPRPTAPVWAPGNSHTLP